MFFNSTKQALNHAHTQWNGLVFKTPNPELITQIQTRLKAHQVLARDGDIWVTNAGFVIMAIHTDHAVELHDALAVPGIDHQGQRGFLVLRQQSAPFHSLASTAVEAVDEALEAKAKADALLAAFGNKQRLRRAVQNAPWHLLSTAEDYERSGLCRWGTESFLQRLGLLGIAKRVGLPRLLLRLAGPYGDRLTAHSLIRNGLICKKASLG